MPNTSVNDGSAAMEVVSSLDATSLRKTLILETKEKLELERRNEELGDRCQYMHRQLEAAKAVLTVALQQSGELLDMCDVARVKLTSAKEMPF